VDETIAELALPPASGGSRTRIGGYDGSGTLLGWLAATIRNRLSRRSRERVRAEGDLATAGAPAQPSPLSPLVDDEVARSAERALAAAWPRLEAHERAAVVWKYRHGSSQRSMARLLGVGEESVSRWVSRALAKLRGALEPLSPEGPGAPRSERYEALLGALERRLATSSLEMALPTDPVEGA
jgi:RNA polymerase sigma factor (sigma-70 family)